MTNDHHLSNLLFLDYYLSSCEVQYDEESKYLQFPFRRTFTVECWASSMRFVIASLWS